MVRLLLQKNEKNVCLEGTKWSYKQHTVLNACRFLYTHISSIMYILPFADNFVYEFDIKNATNRWTKHSLMSGLFSDMDCSYFNGSLFAFGGFEREFPSNKIYNNKSNHWEKIKNMCHVRGSYRYNQFSKYHPCFGKDAPDESEFLDIFGWQVSSVETDIPGKLMVLDGRGYLNDFDMISRVVKEDYYTRRTPRGIGKIVRIPDGTILGYGPQADNYVKLVKDEESQSYKFSWVSLSPIPKGLYMSQLIVTDNGNLIHIGSDKKSVFMEELDNVSLESKSKTILKCESIRQASIIKIKIPESLCT